MPQKFSSAKRHEKRCAEAAMDLFDPATWKSVSDELDTLKGIVTDIRTLAATLGLAGLAGWVVKRFGRKKGPEPTIEPTTPAPPRLTTDLRFVSDDQGTNWGFTSNSKRVSMNVYGHWHVTNLSDHDIRLLKARLRGHEARHVRVMAVPPDTRYAAFSSKETLRSGRLSEVQTLFIEVAPVCDEGQSLIDDVIFTDNRGDEHVVPQVRFPPTPGQRRPTLSQTPAVQQTPAAPPMANGANVRDLPMSEKLPKAWVFEIAVQAGDPERYAVAIEDPEQAGFELARSRGQSVAFLRDLPEATVRMLKLRSGDIRKL
jgi:hypothetical protein